MKTNAYKKFIESMKSYKYPKIAKTKRAATAKQLEALAKGRAFRSTQITDKYSQAWNEYQSWVQSNKKLIKREQNVLLKYSQFEEVMKFDKRLQGLSIHKKIVKLQNEAKYQMKYQHARRLGVYYFESRPDQSQSYEEWLEDTMQQTHQEFAKNYKVYIDEYVEELRKEGKTNKEIAAILRYRNGS